MRGPLSAGAHDAEVQRIGRFREQQYRERMPHLLSEEQLRIEQQLSLDDRSVHFLAERNGEVVGCVRATATPFEFSSLSRSLAELGPRFDGFLELSRLVVAPDERGGRVAVRLLTMVCAWGQQQGHAGIVGLCRAGTRALFQRYGLSAASPIQHAVDCRPGETYTLMASTWPRLLATAASLADGLEPRTSIANSQPANEGSRTMHENARVTSGLDMLKSRNAAIWQEIMASSRFVQTIRKGEVTKALYGLYLLETYHYTRHNARNQALVAVRMAEDDRQYQKFCFTHASEEVGHEMMAMHDLISLGVERPSTIPQPMSATEVLIAYLYWVSYQGNPLQRLGYSFWAESCYEYVRPLLHKVQQGLSLTSAQMTFFVAHAEIDAEHEQTVNEMITKRCTTDRDWEAVAQVMETSLRLTGHMMDQVFDEYLHLVEGKSDRYAFLKGL